MFAATRDEKHGSSPSPSVEGPQNVSQFFSVATATNVTTQGETWKGERNDDEHDASANV